MSLRQEIWRETRSESKQKSPAHGEEGLLTCGQSISARIFFFCDIKRSMDGRVEREWQLLRNPSVLIANGILLFEDEDQQGAECGRV